MDYSFIGPIEAHKGTIHTNYWLKIVYITSLGAFCRIFTVTFPLFLAPISPDPT